MFDDGEVTFVLARTAANHCSSACLESTTAVLFFCNPTLSLSVSAIFFYYFRLCSKHSRRHDHEQVITSEGWPRRCRKRRWVVRRATCYEMSSNNCLCLLRLRLRRLGSLAQGGCQCQTREPWPVPPHQRLRARPRTSLLGSSRCPCIATGLVTAHGHHTQSNFT